MKKRIFSVALALCVCFSSQPVAHAWQEDSLPQEEVLTEESTSEPATYDSTLPTPTEVYQAMIALKDQDMYKEGVTWTTKSLIRPQKDIIIGKAAPLMGRILLPRAA